MRGRIGLALVVGAWSVVLSGCGGPGEAEPREGPATEEAVAHVDTPPAPEALQW